MTSVVTGVPDRYRLLDEVGRQEVSPTGLIRTWRAKDRVLNRDVAVRVHAPGGLSARGWIRRALTAGGLATPALAMVYDAAEGSDTPTGPGGAAYVVNEWIEGATLVERMAEGPMTEREVRTVLRRLAEGVAEAHRVGLAVGGLVPESVVLRPNGLVGLRAVPAAVATIPEDIAALGALLEFCLTAYPGAAGSARIAAPELAALVRRARSTEPGGGLSSAAAMADLLGRPARPGRPVHLVRTPDESDSGWLRRLRERPADDDLTILPFAQHDARSPDGARYPGADAADDEHAYDAFARNIDDDDDRPQDQGTYDHETYDHETYDHETFDQGPYDEGPFDDAGRGGRYTSEAGYGRGSDDADEDGPPPTRRRLTMVLVLVVAFALVVTLAWWLGTKVLSVPTEQHSTPPSASTSTTASVPPSGEPASETPPATGQPLPVTSSVIYNPQDSDPENDGDVGLTTDGDPATSWSTVTYRGSAQFAGLKDGVGIVYDLGSEQPLSTVTITSTTPGAVMELRTADSPDAPLDDWAVVGQGTVTGTTDIALDQPVTTQYLLVWVTTLAPGDGGFSADIAEVVLHAAG